MCRDDSGTEVPIVVFECRGMEPIKWSPEVRPPPPLATDGVRASPKVGA